MKQTFQFHRSSFSMLTYKTLGIKDTSFKDAETVEHTIKNCLISLNLNNLLSVDDISFSNGNIGEKTFVHFTVTKAENVSEKEFLKALKFFNPDYSPS
jgi:hypothetical protein